MALAPSLVPGLEAYQRDDYDTAREKWRECHFDEEGEANLLAALTALATGIEQARQGHLEDAEESFDQTRSKLQALPRSVLGVDIDLLRVTLRVPADELAESPPPILAATRFPPGTLRFAAFIALLIATALIFRFTALHQYLDRQEIIRVLAAVRDSVWAPVALMASFILLAPLGLPISPLIMAGGVVFGTAKGSLFNYVGSVLGAGLSYQLARYLGRDFVVQIAGKRLKRVETMVSRYGFWSLAGIRLMPIPFPVANFGMALAGVRLPTFVASTAVGLTPGVLMYTYLATVLAAAAEGSSENGGARALEVVVAILLFSLVGLTPTLLLRRKRQLRYRKIRRRRQRRPTRRAPPNP
ncbi:MAG: TVP38/TMEM64 family protein [Thermoanaerobaculia bacterium]|nr:TVP38/TMEM64 family protein [Thermoanaerobaculia bacterium]